MSDELAIPEEFKRNIFLTVLDKFYNWTRRYSMWPLAFGPACCMFEFVCAAASRYDISRFGMEIFRASPRQADLMMVAGTVTHKMAPVVRRLYDQMAEPKYVIAMGVCSISGGVFQTYSVLQGVDKIVPVDVYIPGCPPRPEAVLHGVMMLHEQVEQESLRTVPWYGKRQRKEAAAAEALAKATLASMPQSEKGGESS